MISLDINYDWDLQFLAQQNSCFFIYKFAEKSLLEELNIIATLYNELDIFFSGKCRFYTKAFVVWCIIYSKFFCLFFYGYFDVKYLMNISYLWFFCLDNFSRFYFIFIDLIIYLKICLSILSFVLLHIFLLLNIIYFDIFENSNDDLVLV